MLLRLGVLLNRSRRNADIPAIALAVTDDSLLLRFDPDWLEANPLTVADLTRERRYLADVGYRLEFG